MTDTNYMDARTGTMFVFQERKIIINGAELNPLDVIEAAGFWLRNAREHDWPLLDCREMMIDKDALVARLGLPDDQT